MKGDDGSLESWGKNNYEGHSFWIVPNAFTFASRSRVAGTVPAQVDCMYFIPLALPNSQNSENGSLNHVISGYDILQAED